MITFEQIRGYETEKNEIVNIVNMINNYEIFNEKGIALPRGLLLYGRPGVGKTMFAQAMANALESNFVEIDFGTLEDKSASEIIKEKFSEALEKAPSVILLDEIDKILPNDIYGSHHVSDEKTNIVNLLHNYLDGFQKREDIFLITIANNPHMIPDSLKRSGRLDKHIRINLPDEHSRKEIITSYMNSIKIDSHISIEELVSQTHTLTGSDIKTAINEAAIDAVTKKETLNNSLIIKHIRRISRKDLMTFTEEDKNSVVAYHELGHFIVANKLKQEIIDVSIISTSDYLGRVRIKGNDRATSINDYFDMVTILVAGAAAEIVFFKKRYLGGGIELSSAYELLEQVLSIGGYGLEHVRKLMLISDSEIPKTRKKTLKVLKKAIKRATKIIRKNKKLLIKIHDELIEKGVLTGSELEKYVNGEIVSQSFGRRKFSEYSNY